MLTDRRYSSQVAFITGREAEGKEDTNIDWNVLARFPGTLVFYMGIGTLPHCRATDRPADRRLPVALWPMPRCRLSVSCGGIERIVETCSQAD
jgi:uroporphyrinogen III methyltransferase/synthase